MIRVIAFAFVLVAVVGAYHDAAHAAKNTCIRIHRQGNIETLVNVCGVCRVAIITRARPGNRAPVSRQYNVQAKSTFPVPFKGPGRSRVKSDMPCPGDAGGERDLLKERSNPQTEEACVSLEQSEQGNVLLVNRCGICRAVAIDRYTGKGPKARDYMLVAAGKAQVVPPRGYANVALLGDIACP